MNNLQKHILELIQSNASSELKALLEDNKVDLNFRDRSKCSPLYLAVEKRSDKLVEILLANQADPNFINSYEKESALYNYVVRAATENSNDDKSIAIAKKLIEAGANVDFKVRSNDLSLLHYAVMRKNDLLVKLLLESGSDVNEHKNRDKVSPICFPSNPEIVKILIDANANLKHLQKNNVSILKSYVNKKSNPENLEMANIILKNMESINEENISLMGLMIQDLNHKYFDLFIKFNFEIRKEDLIMLLNKSVLWENSKAADLLLAHFNFEFVQVEDAKENPLYNSIIYGYKSMTKRLLATGASMANMPENLKQKLKNKVKDKKMKKLIGLE